MSRVVFDASAVIAFLRRELGADTVAAYRGNAIISAVNIAESALKLPSHGMSLLEARKSIAVMNMEIIPFDLEQSYYAASIHGATRAYGLSLGDCACLQLAMSRGIPVLTADRIWNETDLDVEVILIR